jgi:hypothetical protein
MATVTNFKCRDEKGFPILCDAYGNNAALRCPSCGGPILATFLPNQKGSDETHPASCVSCGLMIWVELDDSQKRLTLHCMATK